MSTDAINATGRRKTSIARIQMRPGEGTITVNDRPMEEYFPTVQLQNSLVYPLHVADSAQKYNINVIAHGGGINPLSPHLRSPQPLTQQPHLKSEFLATKAAGVS